MSSQLKGHSELTAHPPPLVAILSIRAPPRCHAPVAGRRPPRPLPLWRLGLGLVLGLPPRDGGPPGGRPPAASSLQDPLRQPLCRRSSDLRHRHHAIWRTAAAITSCLS